MMSKRKLYIIIGLVVALIVLLQVFSKDRLITEVKSIRSDFKSIIDIHPES